MSARRAAFGVAFKNARRNRKRTFYLMLLIGIPVMVAVITSAVVRLGHVSAEESATSRYGQTNVVIDRSFSTPEVDVWVNETIHALAPEADRLSFRETYTGFAPRVAGRITDTDLSDPLSRGVLGLVAGSAPNAPDEAVLTEHLATILEAGIGDEVELGQDNLVFEVVGLSSHPLYWETTEVVVSPAGIDRFDVGPEGIVDQTMLTVDDDVSFAEQFGLAWERDRYGFYPKDREWPMPERYGWLWEELYASMSEGQLAELDRILLEEGEEAAVAYADSLSAGGIETTLPNVYAQSRTLEVMWAVENIAETGPVVGTGVAAVILIEVAFIAGAAFATGTRRRLREIGLMGANGASTKHLRASVIGEGLVVGLLGGLLGSFLAFLLITLGRSSLQKFVVRRIDGFPFSVLDMLGPIVVAVIACVIAAWMPARTASAVPTLTALQGRIPVGAPKRWLIPLGVGLTAFGALLLGVGLAGGSGGAGAVAVMGAVLMIGGTALLAGPLVAWISKHAEQFPITPRIVLRDSGRQRGRAAAAVAATMVILMAPVGALVTLAQSEAQQGINGLPLTEPQALVLGTYDPENGSPLPIDEDLLDQVAAIIPGSRMASFRVIDVPIKYPAELAAADQGIAENDGQYYLSPWRMSVASDELVAMLDDDRLDAALAADGIALIGVEDRLSEVEIDGEVVSIAEVPIAVQRWAFPRVMVSEETAARYEGFEAKTMAMIETDQTWLQRAIPFDDPMLPLWETDLNLEVSGGGEDSPAAVFAFVFLATMLIVLIVVATITALSAAEADNDLRTVVAVGATNSVRRKYLGLQSGIHTLLGTLLAVPLTLLVMWTAYQTNFSGGYRAVGHFGVFDSSQVFIPWLALALLVVGLPLAIGLITAATVRSAPTTPPRRAT